MYDTNIYKERGSQKVESIIVVDGHCLHIVGVLILVAVVISVRLEIIRRCFSKYNV